MIDLPQEPIEQLERLANIIERLQPRLEEPLGQLATQAASPEALVWVEQLEHAGARMYTVLNTLFEQTQVILTVAEPEPTRPEPAPEPELLTEAPEDSLLTTLELDLLRYLATNPYSRLETLHSTVPGTESWTTKEFKSARKAIQESLADQGIKIDFDTKGRTRGVKYAIIFDDDDCAQRLHALLYPPQTSAPVIIEESGSQPAIDATARFEPVTPNDSNGNGHQTTTSQATEVVQQTSAPANPIVLLPDEVLLDFIANQPQQVGIPAIATQLYEVFRLPQGIFFGLNDQLRRLVEEGQLDQHPTQQRFVIKGQPFITTNNGKAPSSTDADFEVMMKRTRGIKGNPQAHKPAQRGRRHGGKRRGR